MKVFKTKLGANNISFLKNNSCHCPVIIHRKICLRTQFPSSMNLMGCWLTDIMQGLPSLLLWIIIALGLTRTFTSSSLAAIPAEVLQIAFNLRTFLFQFLMLNPFIIKNILNGSKDFQFITNGLMSLNLQFPDKTLNRVAVLFPKPQTRLLNQSWETIKSFAASMPDLFQIVMKWVAHSVASSLVP